MNNNTYPWDLSFLNQASVFSTASCILQLPSLQTITSSCITHKHQKLVLVESKKGAVNRERVYYRLSWIDFTVSSVLCHL